MKNNQSFDERVYDLSEKAKNFSRTEQILDNQSEEGEKTVHEWMTALDLVCRKDQDMLLRLCRKMVHYLCLRGVKEAEELLIYPANDDLTILNAANMKEKAFKIASNHMCNNEISQKLKSWLQEEKIYPLMRAMDRLDFSVKEIVYETLNYCENQDNTIDSLPAGHWLVTSLIRRFLSEKLELINVGKKYLKVTDFYGIVSHLIFPDGSHGKIGGKGAGLFAAGQILTRASEDMPILKDIKIPKTWYLSTDLINYFLQYNHLEELNTQKYKDLFEIRVNYPNIDHLIKKCEFPFEIKKQLETALEDFGDSPLIVRSSSLLEDQMGAVFSGKYKSLFLANQGNHEQRLQALMDAIAEIYASIFSPDSIQYRLERGLIDFEDEMGILIQEVIGTRVGDYFLPLYAGVAFSINEFRWSPEIKREDGLVRLVMGLGTRAVDRITDDFPVLLSPGQPQLRVNMMPDEIKRYSPQKADVINLKNDCFESIEINTLIKEYGKIIPDLHQLVSIYSAEEIINAANFDFEPDYSTDELIITFDGLINNTLFISRINAIQHVLANALKMPVDIEFAYDGEHFYLLQCRPQSFTAEVSPAAIPQDISPRDIVFSAKRYIPNGIIKEITYIVYVDPESYDELEKPEDLIKVGKVVSLLNSLLPRKQFVLMGPGRWGTRGDLKRGVQVSYADINNAAALIEIARKSKNYLPELSFGTHFFQDLVESHIYYLPLYPDEKDVSLNENFLRKTNSILEKILPEYSFLRDVVRVINIPENCGGNILTIAMNADLDKALAYISTPTVGNSNSGFAEAECAVQPGKTYDEKFWRWRYYMAERIADSTDFEQYGIKGIYVFGSVNNGTAGPGSDIDLLIHFEGTQKQREELLQYFNGWSLCLSEMNYLKTGYVSDGLLDVHIVTDEDIANKTSYAIKIGAVTDPAHPLKIRK